MIENVLATYPEQIQFPELSREYRARIDSLPSTLDSSLLQDVKRRLKLSSLTSAANVLYEPLANKEGSIKEAARTKAHNLARGYILECPRIRTFN